MFDDQSSMHTVSLVQDDTFPETQRNYDGDDLEYSISQYKSKEAKSVYPDNTCSNLQIAIEVEDLMERINRIE